MLGMGTHCCCNCFYCNQYWYNNNEVLVVLLRLRCHLCSRRIDLRERQRWTVVHACSNLPQCLSLLRPRPNTHQHPSPVASSNHNTSGMIASMFLFVQQECECGWLLCQQKQKCQGTIGDESCLVFERTWMNAFQNALNKTEVQIWPKCTPEKLGPFSIGLWTKL